MGASRDACKVANACAQEPAAACPINNSCWFAAHGTVPAALLLQPPLSQPACYPHPTCCGLRSAASAAWTPKLAAGCCASLQGGVGKHVADGMLESVPLGHVW